MGGRSVSTEDKNMDEFRCAIEIREQEGVNRLVGVLMNYGERAKDRAEVFEPGSLKLAGIGPNNSQSANIREKIPS